MNDWERSRIEGRLDKLDEGLQSVAISVAKLTDQVEGYAAGQAVDKQSSTARVVAYTSGIALVAGAVVQAVVQLFR